MNIDEKISVEDSNMLSELPNCVLINILTKLKVTEMVRTCILSKRWIKLWIFVPCLRFNYSEFRDLERFENFVSSFLRLRDNSTDLASFSLSHRESESDCVTMWIDYVLKHNPKKLHVELKECGHVHLPDVFFTCEFLEDVYLDLEIKGDKEEIKPDKVYLPRLKKLYFGYVSFNGDYLEKLLIGCPMLESFSMFECDLNVKKISFRTLKNLSIVSKCSVSDPVLESLEFSGFMSDSTKLKEMSKVTKANISVYQSEDGDFDYNHELLVGLLGVEDLSMDCVCFKHRHIEEPIEWLNCKRLKKIDILYFGGDCELNRFVGLLWEATRGIYQVQIILDKIC
ncbi:hypothetical protein LUZ60_003812 [Juncus effusus]|nr:hypothetical protein LUZ60_003812 [Juncus effusus]